jgi:hypothetical protein
MAGEVERQSRIPTSHETFPPHHSHDDLRLVIEARRRRRAAQAQAAAPASIPPPGIATGIASAAPVAPAAAPAAHGTLVVVDGRLCQHGPVAFAATATRCQHCADSGRVRGGTRYAYCDRTTDEWRTKWTTIPCPHCHPES